MISKLSKLLISVLFITYASQAMASNNSDIFDSKNNQIAGITPLMMAVSDGDINGIKFFLNSTNRGNINQKNIGGATALHIATRQNNPQIIQILISAGADINIQDNEGWTPLMRAANAANNSGVRQLLDAGAKIDELNKSGESAIIHASKSSCYKCLRTLLGNVEYYNSFKSTKTLSGQISTSFIAASAKEDSQITWLLKAYQERNQLNEEVVKPKANIKYSLREKKVVKKPAQSKKVKYIMKGNKSSKPKQLTTKKKVVTIDQQAPEIVETHTMDLKPANNKVYKFKSNKTSQAKKKYIFKRY